MFGLFEKNPSLPAHSSRLRPACFGKMPIYSDFIRYNLGSREAGAFEKWLLEGVACIARKHITGIPLIFRNYPPYRFVLSGSEQETSLIGTLISSQDKCGRVYPFAMFAGVAEEMFLSNRAAIPMVHQQFFRESENLFATASSLSSIQALTEKLDGMAAETAARQQRDLLEQQIRLLEKVPLKNYWAGLQIPVHDREQFWCAFYDIMKSVRNRGPSRTNWGVRIPIPSGSDQTPFVVFWVLMIEAILEDRFWRAQYFWNGATGDHPSCLTLFFRPMPPSYLLPLIDQRLDDNAIFDLGREWRSLASFKSRVDLRRLLENDDLPMVEVLYRTGRKEMIR